MYNLVLETISEENQQLIKEKLLYRTFVELNFVDQNDPISAHNDKEIHIKLDDGTVLKTKTKGMYNYGMVTIENFIKNTIITDVKFEIGKINDDEYESHSQVVKIHILHPVAIGTTIICDVNTGEDDYYWGSCVIEIDQKDLLINHIEKGK